MLYCFYLTFDGQCTWALLDCDRLHLPFEPERIPRLKSGMRPGDRQLSDYYDAGAIAQVEQDYALELSLFHYPSPVLSG
ncbi:MAG: hypothetical protein WBA57_24435 [Elainellaceae cyanobacterium]